MKSMLVVIAVVVGCGPPMREQGDDVDAPVCDNQCSADLHAITDCHGNEIQACTNGTACNATSATCENACQAADENHHSVGCDYYATQMEAWDSNNYCFAV